MKTFKLLICGVAAASIVGCRCGGGTNQVLPDYLATPAALSFEACPTKDETGKPVPDVFPDAKKVTIENRSKTGAGLKLSITGADADAFKVLAGDAGVPTSIGSLSSVEIPISFSPTKKGDLRAELVIDDEYDGTDDQKVTLVGTGKNLPAQASIETAPAKPTGQTGFFTCQEGSPLADCSLEFPDTLFEQSSTMQLKIRNKGCPTLKITGLEIESAGGDTQGFTIDQPAQLPSSTTPILLSTADGTDEITVIVRFTPTDDGSGNNQRFASLKILSNDPLYGDGFAAPARIALNANALKPSIYTSPTFCDFSNPLDTCGNAMKVTDKALFRVTNDGNTSIRIDSVKFKSTGGSSGTGGRFTITQNVEGNTIAAGMSANLEITHNDMPLYVTDQIEIVATIPGQGTGSGGTVVVAVYGGKKPCLTTEPIDQINFMNPMQELSAQPFRVKNGANCGTLVVNEVSIDTSPFFSLIDPVIPPNSQIPAGGQLETTVQYKRPPSGGMQLGTLRVKTNDTDFGPPQYKIVQLYSASPLDQVPIASLTACTPPQIINDPQCTMGSSMGMSVNLSMIMPKEITLSGKNSTDDNMVKEYRFKLLPPFPPNVTSAALAGNDTKVMTPTTKLTIPAGGTGLYRVSLEVWDDRGQKSGNTAVMNINVYP